MNLEARHRKMDRSVAPFFRWRTLWAAIPAHNWFFQSNRACALAGLCCILFWFFSPSPGICAERTKEQQEALNKAERLTEQGRKLRNAGKLKEAVPLFEETVGILEKALGDAAPETIDSIFRLARLHHDLRDDPNALKLYERIVPFFEE